jgi:5-methylcytosine-specific restriction enzyme A
VSTNRVSPDAGWVPTARLPKGPNGRALCRNCGTEVPRGRRSFCGDPCVEAWVVKTNPTRMRRVVFRRDHGVCAVCGFDTTQLSSEFQRLKTWHEQRDWYAANGIPKGRREFWDADHVVPVVEGGGECGIENIRTLCLPCHRAETAKLMARRAERRRAERRQRTLERMAAAGNPWAQQALMELPEPDSSGEPA